MLASYFLGNGRLCKDTRLGVKSTFGTSLTWGWPCDPMTLAVTEQLVRIPKAIGLFWWALHGRA